MRIFAGLIAAAALAACATAVDTSAVPGTSGLAPLPFPVERGSALPPPAASTTQGAPPEGAGPGGIDFGQWRNADPAVYAPTFQSQVRQRYAGRTNPQIKTDLEANGFACEEGQNLDCRIEIMERQCAHDWYVVVERNSAEPVAGYDKMCLGAR
jgi:hypothetical protein